MFTERNLDMLVERNLDMFTSGEYKEVQPCYRNRGRTRSEYVDKFKDVEKINSRILRR